MAEPDGAAAAFRHRASVALAVAVVLGVVAAFVAASAVERVPYDDGIELFLPTTVAFLAAAGVVLLGFVVWEAYRGGRAALVPLSVAARRLAGLAFFGGTLLLVALRLPPLLAMAYGVGGAAVCGLASVLLRAPTRHENPTSLISHSGVQSPPGGEG